MALFLDILTKVSLPIVVLVAIGWALQGRLQLDVASLNRLQMQVVLPAFMLHSLATGKQPLSAVWPVFYAGFVLFLLVIPIGWLTVLLFRQRPSLGPMMGLATGYANVGFFGIPVTLLAFGPDHVIYMSVMTALTTILICTVGVAVLAPAGSSWLSKVRIAFETPLIPSVALGLALRGLDVEMPAVVSQPLQFIGSIFTPLALYTLGAQIASSKVVKFEWIPQLLMIVLRFLVAPAIAWALCTYMEFPRDVTNVIVVAAATPVGVLITIFAAEYKTEPEFISTAVVVSTILSPLFVTGWILLTRIY